MVPALGDRVSRRGIAAAVLVAATPGCVPEERETGPGHPVYGSASAAEEVVGLYTRIEVETDKGPVWIMHTWGSGVRLCPSLILTAAHVVDTATGVWVTDDSEIGELRDLVVTDRSTRRRRRVKRRVVGGMELAYATMVDRTTSYPITVEGRDYDDGLAVAQVSTPAPYDLPYPALASRSRWSWRDQVSMIGYGDGTAGHGPLYGVRLQGTARFQSFVQPPSRFSAEPVLKFEGSAGSGDSGGAVTRGGLLAGIQFANIGAAAGNGTTNLSFDVGANREWIVRQRDALCPPRSSWWHPPEEPAVAAQIPLDPVEPAVEPAVAVAGESALDFGEGDEVCLCEGPCEESCPEDGGDPDAGAAPGCSCASDCGCLGDCCPECWVGCGGGDCSCADDAWCEETWDLDGQELARCQCDPDCW